MEHNGCVFVVLFRGLRSGFDRGRDHLGNGRGGMIPTETALLVLVLAALSSINALFPKYRWLSFVSLSLAVLGVSGVVSADPVYDSFFVFAPQIFPVTKHRLSPSICCLFSPLIASTRRITRG